MPSAITPRNNRTKRLPAPPTDEITLQIVGGEHHGRTVRITAPKCTVGSAPGCTLRLRATGVAPLHCLILRGPNGVVVRRMADDARLNGREFDDAPLAANDQLEIGSVMFVVVQVPLSQQAAAETAGAGPQPLSEEARELIRDTRRRAKLRARNLLNALRAGKRQADQLQRQIESRKLEFEQAARQTAALNRELTAQRDRQRTTEDEQRAAVLQVGQLTASLERLRHELLAVQSQRQSEADRWRLDRSRMTEDLALRESRLHEAEGQLQQKQWELEQLYLQFQRQQRQLELEHEQAIAARQRREKDAETAALELGRVNEELLAQDRARLQAENDLQTAKRELDALRETTVQLRGELQTRAEELSQLREANDRSVREWQIERLKIVQEVGQAAAHDARLLTEHRKQLEDAAAQVRALETQLADLQVAATTRDADSQAQYRRELNDARALSRAYEAQIAELQSATATRDAELAALRDELSGIHDELAGLRDELAGERQGRLAAEEKWQESERSAAQTSEATQRQLDELQAEAKRLEALLAERDAEVARLLGEQREQTIQWSATKDQAAEVESAAAERLQTLEARLLAAREDAANAAAELAATLTLQAENNRRAEVEQERLNRELTALRSQVGELQTSLNSAQDDLTSARGELTGAQAQLEAAAIEAEGKLQAEAELERLNRELTALRSQVGELQTSLSSAQDDLTSARGELTEAAAELHDVRGRDLQTIVYQKAAPETPAIDPEQVAALERKAEELAALEARLAAEQAEFTRERDAAEATLEQSRTELQSREDHANAESSRIAAGMHQLQEFEAQLVRQQDELSRQQREWDSREVATPVAIAEMTPPMLEEPAATDDEAGFLMPVESPSHEDTAAPPITVSSAPEVTQPYFATPAEEPENLEPGAETPFAENANDEEPPRMVTQPYFGPIAAREVEPESPPSLLLPPTPAEELRAESSPVIEPVNESRLITPEPESQFLEPTAAEQPEPEQPRGSNAFERRLAALAAEAAKARGSKSFEDPQPEPAAPEPQPASEPTGELIAPTESPAASAMSADLLPQWRFEHETPERMDTITGLRMRNLLDEIKHFPSDVGGAGESKPRTLADIIPQPSAMKLQLDSSSLSEPTPPVIDQPLEDIDIFSRLKEAGILKSDPVEPIQLPPRDESTPRSYLPPPDNVPQDEPEQLLELPPIPIAETPNPFAASKPAEATGEEEESIEDYMQQLLQRVRGDGPPTGTGANPVYRAAATPSAPDEAPKKAAAPPPPKPDLPPVKPEEYVPRSTAAERTVNLAAMRELANSQARNAIQTHQKKVGLQLSGGKLITAVVALVTAVVLVWSGSSNNLRLTMAAGGLGAVIGLYWLLQAMFFSLGWKVGGRK